MSQGAQAQAADPAVNAFVTANAGTGKTKTLIDRVARLLLRKVEPEAILCVTYTRAAAAEMQHRLFARLGAWSVMEDKALSGELADLVGGARPPDDITLSEARKLFAKALETPGGLRIQTIHAFCEKLLRRFPVEAELPPGFTVMDDAEALLVAREARDRLATLALDEGGVVGDAFARLAVALDIGGFEAMFRVFEDRRAALADYVARCGGLEALPSAVAVACGLEALEDPGVIEAEAFSPPAIDAGAWRRAAEALLASGAATDRKHGGLAAAVAEAAQAGESRPEAVRKLCLTDDGEPRKTLGTKAVDPAILQWLAREQARVCAALARARAARVAEDTVMVLTLAAVYARAYEAAKRDRRVLDFGDLVDRAHALVATRPDAAWVLYKLDGGIDHILVDEAQDTAPEQWDILNSLAGEFFTGADAPRTGAVDRSLFVVGDVKQSIYSFQGAEPARLLAESRRYALLAEGAGRPFLGPTLDVSFRSTREVLAFVDAVFVDPAARRGVPPPADQDVVRHEAFRRHQGCVDLWPLEREEKGEARDAWADPLDAVPAASANRRLADRIAAEIKGIVARGDAVHDRDSGDPRPARYGDILILVRRRKALFEEILRRLKLAGVPVAGADRLSLSAHIAFDDLVALARFALFPADDLTLAGLLKSPFCGLSDDDLFDLAHGRRDSLWRVLRDRADERPPWREAVDRLETVRSMARDRRPFDFYRDALGLRDAAGRSMRARLVTRLGAEAGDVVDEFLARALEAERRGIADLEQLAHVFARLEVTVKRELESAVDEVRVMTAHGAKGLEAPIVFVPETTVGRTGHGSPLLETEHPETGERGFLWCARTADDCAASAAARARRKKAEEDEAWRLLYVALTRARDRLVLCGRIDARTPDDRVGGWYAALRAALERPELAGAVRTVPCGDLQARRYGPDPLRATDKAAPPPAPAAAPGWLSRPPPAEAPGLRFASPSQLAERERGPALSPLDLVGGLGRYRRGDLVHRLLQLLPDIASDERRAAAARMLDREPDLTPAQRAEIAAAAFGVLEDPAFAEVFGPGSRAEAAIAGSSPRLPEGLAVSGRVDRLLVAPGRVLVVDFKTNRPPPSRIEDADFAYLAQMAVYSAVLGEIYPGSRVEAALVWTDGPRLMPVPEIMIARTLDRLGRTH
ncbi:MAG: double-strand break repair helicase AddA [Pseudomonadota bacterium]